MCRPGHVGISSTGSLYSTAYQSNKNDNCKFSDTTGDAPEHSLTAQPVASVHQVDSLKRTLNVMC